VLVFDADTEELVRVVPQPEDSLSWMNANGAPPGEAYLYSAPGGDLYHYDIEADELTVLAPNLGQCEQVVDGRYVHGINDQEYFLYDLEEKRELCRSKLAEAVDGMRIQTLTGALDGNIYGSTYINQHMFRYSPETGELVDLGKVIRLGGQVDSIHAGRDGRIYMGSYVHATLSIYDPARAWDPSRDPDGNPRELGMVGHGQYRTQAIVLGPDGNIWVGSIPSYNSAPTGALSRWDPETGERKSWLDLVPGGGIYRIAADGRYLYCTGGGRFFVWDPIGESKVHEEGRAAYSLVLTAAGEVLGNSGDEMFVFDPDEMRVSATFPSPIGRMDSMVLGPDGRIYGINDSGIADIDPEARTGRKVSSEGGHLIATLPAGDIYFARGAALYRLEP
jgi:sugar lactone lactonase YvrE